MGLAGLSPDNSSNDDSSSSSSSSGSSGGSSSGSSDHPFPKYQRKCPQVVVTKDGEIRKYPETVACPFKKDWYSAPWQLDCPWPEDWLEVWWGESNWELDQMIYEERVGRPLEQDFQSDPEGTKKRLLNARSDYTSDNTVQESKRVRRCACCQDEIDLKYGDYEEIDNSVVCESHNVQELSSAGVI